MITEIRWYRHVVNNNVVPITHTISARSKIAERIVLSKHSDWLHSQGHNHWMPWCNYSLISLPNELDGRIYFSSERNYMLLMCSYEMYLRGLTKCFICTIPSDTVQDTHNTVTVHINILALIWATFTSVKWSEKSISVCTTCSYYLVECPWVFFYSAASSHVESVSEIPEHKHKREDLNLWNRCLISERYVFHFHKACSWKSC